MSVDTRVSLPGNVRVDDVASVLGKLFGLPSTLDPLGPDHGVACRVSGAHVRQCADIPTMVRIELRKANGDHVFACNYHFEMPGGRRLLSASSRAETIAAFRGVADFFGGKVDYGDWDSEYADHSVEDKPDDENHPEDGEPWNTFQTRMHAVKPLTRAQIKACKPHAAYDG
jgi:hypothetical protein